MKRSVEKALSYISGILGIIMFILGGISIIVYQVIQNNPSLIEGPGFEEYKDVLTNEMTTISAYTYVALIALLVASILSIIAGVKINNENNKKMGKYLFVSVLFYIISQSWLLAVISLFAGLMSYLRSEDITVHD